MSTVVSCPECQRKLKVAPDSLGKKVRCPDGHVFVAQASAEALAPADVIVVHCTGCGTKLKVPASAQGRKMKCSSCAAVFVVGGAAPPPPPLPVVVEPEPLVEEDAELPRARRPLVGRVSDADWVESASRKPKPLPRTTTVSRVPGAPLLTALTVLIALAYGGVLAALYLDVLDEYLPQPPRPQLHVPLVIEPEPDAVEPKMPD